MGKMTVNKLKRMFANPYYAIEIHPELCTTHELMVTEEMWIKANVQSIKESGAENFLRILLDVLKGNYLTSEEFD